MKRTIGVLVIGLALMFTSVYAKNPAKKSYVAKYPQCQVLLEKYHTIKNEINALPAGQVRSERVQEKVAAWKEYKQCEKDAKTQARQSGQDFNRLGEDEKEKRLQELDAKVKGGKK